MELSYYINKFGYEQAYDTEGSDVCSQCGAMYVNTGQGTLCPSCGERLDADLRCMYED